MLGSVSQNKDIINSYSEKIRSNPYHIISKYGVTKKTPFSKSLKLKKKKIYFPHMKDSIMKKVTFCFIELQR